MKNNIELHEKKIIELSRKYKELGYKVISNPSKNQMPFVVGNYIPDLIIEKDGEGFFIEVKVKSKNISLDRFQAIAEEIATHKNWRFLLVTLDDNIEDISQTVENNLDSWDMISERLNKAKQISLIEVDAAMIYLWTIFEMMLRKRCIELGLVIDKLPIKQIINQMYTQGEITVKQINTLEKFMDARNYLVHGYSKESNIKIFQKYWIYVFTFFNEWSNYSHNPENF